MNYKILKKILIYKFINLRNLSKKKNLTKTF